MKNKKVLIYTILMWVFAAMFMASLFFLSTVEGAMKIVLFILIIVGAALSITFSTLANNEKNKNNYGLNNKSEEDYKQAIANFAFDKFLKRDVDYTVMAQVKGAILVKKDVKWYYYNFNASGLHALFIITTDKGDFAFQVENDQLIQVKADIVKSIYEDLDKNKNAQQNSKENETSNLNFADWLTSELNNITETPVAYNINIYENEKNFSCELIGTKSFDKNNDDWATDELYCGRVSGKEFYFEEKDFNLALKTVESNIKDYLKNGECASKLKQSKAVAYGFVDGDLKIVYLKK